MASPLFLIGVAEDGSTPNRKPPGRAATKGNAPVVEQEAVQMTSLRIIVFQLVVFVLFIRLKLIFLRLRFVAVTLYTPETVFINFLGVQESIPPAYVAWLPHRLLKYSS